MRVGVCLALLLCKVGLQWGFAGTSCPGVGQFHVCSMLYLLMQWHVWAGDAAGFIAEYHACAY